MNFYDILYYGGAIYITYNSVCICYTLTILYVEYKKWKK